MTAPNKHSLELFVLSFLSLYLELFIIHWLSADIRAFSLFKTFPLVSCFIGLGLGYANSKRPELINRTPLALLFFCLMMKCSDLTHLSQLFFPSISPDWQLFSSAGWAAGWPVLAEFMIGLVALLAGPFLLMYCIGAKIGYLFNLLQPLKAYCTNIIGAISGSLLFTLCAFGRLTPAILLIPAAVLMLFYCVQRKPRWQNILSLVALVGSIGSAFYVHPVSAGASTYWSPYQRLDLVPITIQFANSKDVPIGFELYANRFHYQQMFDFDRISKLHNLSEKQNFRFDAYRERHDMPYILQHNLDNILIVGAGLGMDVAEALRFGAKHIDAVEIDPDILFLGRQYNPQHPYSSSKVRVYCDDARNFFNNCHKKYDLIVYSYLDSRVVTASSVRLENYVYTKESVQKALTLLKPKGLIVISFFTYRTKRWLDDRLFATTKSSAGYAPYEFRDSINLSHRTTYYIIGPAVANGSFTLPFGLERYQRVTRHPTKNPGILTDDWPYLYFVTQLINVPYLLILLEAIILSVVLARSVLFGKESKHDWQMFFLGAGFLLLELTAINRLSLLYGATWLTTAFVINGVLVMILFANLLIMKAVNVRLNLQICMYVVLLLSLIANYILPTGSGIAAAQQSPFIAGALVTAITLFPIFVAAAIFALAFRNTPSASTALSFNMLGAVSGALLESLSNYLGIKALYLVAFPLYVFSLLPVLKFLKWTRGADNRSSTSAHVDINHL